MNKWKKSVRSLCLGMALMMSVSWTAFAATDGATGPGQAAGGGFLVYFGSVFTGGRRHGLRRSSFGSNGYFTECSSADGGSAGRSAL